MLRSRANNRKKQRHAESRKDTAKALRLFRDTLRALVAANDAGMNAFDVLDREVGWYKLLQAKPLVEAMVEHADPNPLILAVERYAGIRKYSVPFLRTFAFRSSRRHDPLLSAIAMLKSLNEDGRRTLPDRVPVAHLGVPARKLIFGQDKPDRRLYEIATLAVLRERLRSGDVWIEGSRAFRPIEEHLIPKPDFLALKAAGDLELGVQQDATKYLAEMRQVLDFNLKRLAYRARNGKLEGVRLESGTLIVTPLTSEIPAEAETLNRELSGMYPLVEVPDLLREVHDWTGFADQFTHIRTQEAPQNIQAMLAGVLADATNLGPKRMATASKGISPHQISWTHLFHARTETYRAAQARITDAHAHHPHVRLWGDGTTASADGQFFRASDRAARRSDVNLHYGSEPGSKFYSHLSDQYSYFSILPISPSRARRLMSSMACLTTNHSRHRGAVHRHRRGERPCLCLFRPDRQTDRTAAAQSQGPKASYLREGRRLSSVERAHRRADKHQPHHGMLGGNAAFGRFDQKQGGCALDHSESVSSSRIPISGSREIRVGIAGKQFVVSRFAGLALHVCLRREVRGSAILRLSSATH